MMTQDEIIKMARQAGMAYEDDTDRYIANIDDLQDFAKLVRDDYSNKHAQLWLKRIDEAVKAEREACAKVAEDTKAPFTALAIRARGQE